MMGNFQIRTDLALEARESCEAENVKIRGVKVEEGFSYSSDNNTEWLSVEQIRELLKDFKVEK